MAREFFARLCPGESYELIMARSKVRKLECAVILEKRAIPGSLAQVFSEAETTALKYLLKNHQEGDEEGYARFLQILVKLQERKQGAGAYS